MVINALNSGAKPSWLILKTARHLHGVMTGQQNLKDRKQNDKS
jgi:hypothetical protein